MNDVGVDVSHKILELNFKTVLASHTSLSITQDYYILLMPEKNTPRMGVQWTYYPNCKFCNNLQRLKSDKRCGNSVCGGEYYSFWL